MAFGISRRFNSTDVGAPVWNTGTVGSFIAMIKAVCVTGYGSIASLGWTVEFETANVICLRMKGGTRRCIRFDDITYHSLGFIDVSAFTTMSSLSAGTERMPVPGINCFVQKHISTPSGIMPWTIIGDDAGFWLLHKASWLQQAANMNRYYTTYYGDYNPWDQKSKWNFCLLTSEATEAGGNTSVQNNFYVHTPIVTANRHYAERGYNFVRGCVPIGLLPFNNNVYFGNSMQVVPFTGVANSKLNGVYFQSPIHIYDSVCILGSLPGVSEPIMVDDAVTNTAVNTAQIEISNSDGTSSLFVYNLTNNAALNAIGKLIFRIGKGFRNVQ